MSISVSHLWGTPRFPCPPKDPSGRRDPARGALLPVWHGLLAAACLQEVFDFVQIDVQRNRRALHVSAKPSLA